MSDETIRAKIKEIIERVPNRGIVHDYGRWCADWGKFTLLFQDVVSKKILGWEITRQAAPGTYISNCEEQVNHSYIIRGFMGIQDADRTDIKFNALIDLIRAEFRKDFTLGGLNELPHGFDVRVIDERSFGTVLCHHCEIVIPIQEVQS